MRNQEDNDVERRIILAIILSMAVLFLTPYAYRYFYPEAIVPVETAEQVEPEAAADLAAATGENASVISAESGDVAVATEYTATESTQGVERLLVLENEDIRLHFDTRGAVLKEVELKRYLDTEGNPLQLVAGLTPMELGDYLAVEIKGETGLNSAVYEVDTEQDQISGPDRKSVV